MIASELRGTGGYLVPLLGVEIGGEVLGGIARTVVKQRYKNAESRPIEAVYTFPLPSEAALVGFSMTCAGRRMEGVVKEREEAFLAYDEAVSRGHGAALVDEERRNVFTASVGNLLPGEETTIEVELLERLTADEGALRWCLPTLVAPRYIPGAPNGDRTAHGNAQPTDRVPDADRISPPMGSVAYGISVDIRFLLGEGVTVESPSHVIASSPIDGGVRVRFASEDAALDRDVVITARGGAAGVVTALTHRAEGDGYVAITVVPDLLAHARVGRRQDVVFVVDVSGSMQGASIEQAKAALHLCLRQLREGDRFGVIAFNERQFPFAHQLVPFTQKTLDEVDAWVSSLTADGGTELMQPLVTAGEMAQGGVIVLLTDGQVGNESEILNRALQASRGARLYTFGIGTNISDLLLRDLAKRSSGACELIYPGERIDEKVIAQFARATAARVTDLTLKTVGLDLAERAPSCAPPLVDGEPWSIFARYSKAGEGAIELRGTLDGESYYLRVPVVLLERADRPAIAKLWARERIRELEGADLSPRRAGGNMARITKLALEHGLACSRTSMVVVETREGDRRAHGVPSTRVVPVSAPHGWGMFRPAVEKTALAAASVSRGMLSSVSRGMLSDAAFLPPLASPARASMPLGRSAPAPASAQGNLLAQARNFFTGAPKGEGAAMPIAPSGPAGILSYQLASGLWDDAALGGDRTTRSIRATAAALLALHEAGITTGHGVYGAQIKKAVEALLSTVESSSLSEQVVSLALSAAGLVAQGSRSRASVEAAAKTRGVSLGDGRSVKEAMAGLG